MHGCVRKASVSNISDAIKKRSFFFFETGSVSAAVVVDSLSAAFPVNDTDVVVRCDPVVARNASLDDDKGEDDDNDAVIVAAVDDESILPGSARNLEYSLCTFCRSAAPLEKCSCSTGPSRKTPVGPTSRFAREIPT